MEVGLRTPEGTFHSLADGEAVPIILGAGGLSMLVLSLRAEGIDPRPSDPEVQVEVAGFVMGGEIPGGNGPPADMEWDGTGYVRWDFRVMFYEELCCYLCRDGIVTARIEDRSGRCFEGSVGGPLHRRECPDSDACCGFPDACPDPALTRLCM